jgi:hypothetical protein
MKRLCLRAAAFILLAALPLALGGCIVVEHGHGGGGGYCYYHRC